MKHNILICTVGTSLFHPNLDKLKVDHEEGEGGKIDEKLKPLAQT